jgi:hypothetical protein
MNNDNKTPATLTELVIAAEHTNELPSIAKDDEDLLYTR